MTEPEVKKLEIGQRIKWSDGSLGTVADKNWHAVQIIWDDGVGCIFSFNNDGQWKEVALA